MRSAKSQRGFVDSCLDHYFSRFFAAIPVPARYFSAKLPAGWPETTFMRQCEHDLNLSCLYQILQLPVKDFIRVRKGLIYKRCIIIGCFKYWGLNAEYSPRDSAVRRPVDLRRTQETEFENLLKILRLLALISGPCHWLFMIYYWLLLCILCDLCGITKNGVSWRIFWNLVDILRGSSYNS